jgi:transcription elongation factor Elf1
MATATMSKTLKTWKLACPECGASEAIQLDLNDLATVTCGACSEQFSPETARRKVAEQLRRWTALAGWIAMAGECLAATDVDAESE